jgi:NOL1/NOP2/sun family putative RNA methylase
MKLPVKFEEKMKKLLKDDYEEFMDSFDHRNIRGIRRNSLKISEDDFLKKIEYIEGQIPWCSEGYYINYDSRPGKDIYYHCGLFYIQEPSASLPVELLNPCPGEKVLDLCAAPGGKTTQIGVKMKNKGILIANDVNRKRLLSLKRNIQLFGITNSIVTNETAKTLKYSFENYFDKILVDAPCSGEGMFRRDEKTKNRYVTYENNKFTDIQKEILNNAKDLLKPGGELVYSTCTFSTEENEKIISEFLEKNREFELIDDSGLHNSDTGLSKGLLCLDDAFRIWPHLTKGEGHFAVKLKKSDSFDGIIGNVEMNIQNDKKIDSLEAFVDETGLDVTGWNLTLKKGKIFKETGIRSSGMDVFYNGLEIGFEKNGRFMPSQALASFLKIDDVVKTVNIGMGGPEALKYLKGETLHVEGEKGWNLVAIDGFPVGWGKLSEGILKNHYLKEWRMM